MARGVTGPSVFRGVVTSWDDQEKQGLGFELDFEG